MPVSETDLPPLYARWTRELLDTVPPRERHATCLDCAMAPPEGAVADDGVRYFQPALKCCTFVPLLPNFLVGAALTDPGPEADEGRRSILSRLAADEGVSPLGLNRTRADDAMYQVLASTAFGTHSALRCPHLTDASLCGIWRHRNAVCATWFCKHERGAVGEMFWDHLRDWLRSIEQELAVWCLLEAGWPDESLARVLMPEPSHSPDLPTRLPPRTGIWGEWEGRTAAFYEWCAPRVSSLSWTDLRGLCGPTTVARGEAVRQAFARMQSTTLPPRLVAGPLKVLSRRNGAMVVLTYRGTDPLELSSEAQRVVERFDGRPTPEVMARLRSEDRLDVDDDLIRHLHDFRVLRDAGDGDA